MPPHVVTKGASITQPFHKGSRRQDELSKRHDDADASTGARHLEAPSKPRPGCLCLPRVNGDEVLLGLTVIQRRESLLMRIPHSYRQSFATDESGQVGEEDDTISLHKKYLTSHKKISLGEIREDQKLRN